MIDEKKLIEKLEMLRFFNQRAGRELWQDKQKEVQDIDIENADETLSSAIEALKKCDWIPCSERLPDKEGMYLITSKVFDKTEVQYAFYQKNIKLFICNGKALAWMPIPDPYKQEK